MMRINHLAIYVQDLEVMKRFYETYFQGEAGNLYHNPEKHFTSYFLSFSSGCRLELMHKDKVASLNKESTQEYIGITHFAISVGSKDGVDELTERLRADGYSIIGEPRTTGDGYYESVILDPEGNRVEITI
jgi:lactoylglutathione lyase